MKLITTVSNVLKKLTSFWRILWINLWKEKQEENKKWTKTELAPSFVNLFLLFSFASMAKIWSAIFTTILVDCNNCECLFNQSNLKILLKRVKKHWEQGWESCWRLLTPALTNFYGFHLGDNILVALWLC